MINIYKVINKKKSIFYAGIILLLLIGLISFFDSGLAIGLLLLIFLTTITFLILLKNRIRDKKLYLLFLITLLIHSGTALFIYYTDFRPFGGGADFEGYNQTAIEIAQRFSHGNFSLDGLYAEHYFPVLIGIIYIFTLPKMIIGQLFTAWLAAISILFIYMTVVEIGGSRKASFLVGLIANIYPSYLYFGSVLLKDTVIIPLVFLGLLLSVKMFKNFTWLKFLTFFVVLTGLINVRFYIGYALMFCFIFCWFLVSRFNFKKRIIYGFIIIFLLGFSPQISGSGYYGSNNFIKFLNPKTVTYYREVVYNPSLPNKQTPSQQTPSQQTPSQQTPSQQESAGNSSTFVLETGFGQGPLKFLKNYSKSFIYSLLGPFPWQFRYQRQIVGLAETIPWYLLIIISFYSFINFIRRKGILEFLKFYRFSLPLLIFGVLALGALSLFINNYGIIARIRIPVFICFFSVMSIIIFNNNILYEKVLSYWRSRIHRQPPC